MPQMKPLYWLNLYLIFFSIVIVFLIISFFLMLKKKNINSIINKKSLLTLNYWKW